MAYKMIDKPVRIVDDVIQIDKFMMTDKFVIPNCTMKKDIYIVIRSLFWKSEELSYT